MYLVYLSITQFNLNKRLLFYELLFLFWNTNSLGAWEEHRIEQYTTVMIQSVQSLEYTNTVYSYSRWFQFVEMEYTFWELHVRSTNSEPATRTYHNTLLTSQWVHPLQLANQPSISINTNHERIYRYFRWERLVKDWSIHPVSLSSLWTRLSWRGLGRRGLHQLWIWGVKRELKRSLQARNNLKPLSI